MAKLCMEPSDVKIGKVIQAGAQHRCACLGTRTGKSKLRRTAGALDGSLESRLVRGKSVPKTTFQGSALPWGFLAPPRLPFHLSTQASVPCYPIPAARLHWASPSQLPSSTAASSIPEPIVGVFSLTEFYRSVQIQHSRFLTPLPVDSPYAIYFPASFRKGASTHRILTGTGSDELIRSRF